MFADPRLPSEGPGSQRSVLHANWSYGAYLERFPLLEFDAVQLGAGGFDHRSVEIWGRHSILVRDRLTPLAAFTMVGQPDWVMLIWPHVWTGDFRVDGKVAGPRDVFLLNAGREWFTAGAARDTLSLGIRRSVLTAACANLRGVDAASRCDSILLPRSPAMTAFLVRIFSDALDIARGLGPIAGRLVMPPVFEADMIAGLAACLDSEPEDSVGVNRGRRSAARIVTAAREILHERGPASLTMTGLCSALGIGRTRLHEIFVDTFGISTGQYLRKYRLSQAREWLCDPDDPPPSVKYVALTLGFRSSGRFANDYQKLFGELPSATRERHLARARRGSHDPS